MSRLKKALDGRDSHIFTLRLCIGILSVALVVSLVGWSLAPERIKVDIPPDLRTGSTRGIHERHPFNVYAFALYIFQQLNNWPVKGTEDYKDRIATLSCYFTPRFKAQLEQDYQKRFMQHELNRKRTLQEMIGRNYTNKRVFVESKDSWVAYLDVSINETFRAESVKDIFVRYPIRVVRWDADPECNLWGLALDGFYKKPKRLEKNKTVSHDNSNNISMDK